MTSTTASSDSARPASTGSSAAVREIRRQRRLPHLVLPQQQRPLCHSAVGRRAAGPCGHAARASDNESLRLGWNGRNGPSVALTRKNALFAGSDVGASYCSPDDVVIKQGYFGARH